MPDADVLEKPNKEPKYYGREAAWNGSFKTEEDERSEQEVAKIIEAAWSCECRSFGRVSTLDWFFVRNGDMVGVGELKTRSHSSDKYETVYLNVRKWLALELATTGLGVPAVFVVRWSDCVKWINVLQIDGRIHRIGGCKRIVKSRNDIEPVIEVPISAMKSLSVR